MKPQTITLIIAIATLSTTAAQQQQQQQQYLRATIQDNIIPTHNKGDGMIIDIDDEEPPLSIDNEEAEGYSLIAQQFTNDPFASHDNIQMILNGQLKLAGIRYHPNSFAIDDNNEEKYSEVYGDFCVYDTQINKADPSYYPTVKDVMRTSNHCGEHRYSILLNEVMDAIENNKDDKVKSLQPDGLVSLNSFVHIFCSFLYMLT